MKRRIYLASSWRNDNQPHAVALLRAAGHDVYDFRHPAPGNTGFSWSEIDPDWLRWCTEQYVEALEHPLAVAGFGFDFSAMQWADTFVLLLPCGRSAHIEAGWAVGAGRELYVVHPDGEEPELMAKMATAIVPTVSDVVELLESTAPEEQIVKHGVNCSKAVHDDRGGYLHAEDDDSPYSIDGMTYCGRCHTFIGDHR